MTNDVSAPYLLGRLVYIFLCTFPYMVLILYSFRGHWRFKRSVTFLIVLAAMAFEMATVPVKLLWLTGIRNQFWDVLSSAVYVVFIFAAIKDHIGKLIFTVLVLTNLGTFIIMSAKCFEGFFLPEQAQKGYYFTYHLFIVFMLAAVLPVVYLLVFRDISPVSSDISRYIGEENGKTVGRPLRYLWLVPAIFYVIWMQHFYADKGTPLENSLDPTNTLFLFLIDAGSVLVYRIIIKSVQLYERNLALLAENHAISIQRLSYESINARLENMRRTRHDLRHHTAILKQIRQSGDLEALDGLIDMYTEQNYLDQPLQFCENETVNILFLFYSETAYKVTPNGTHSLMLSIKNSFVTTPTVNERGI